MSKMPLVFFFGGGQNSTVFMSVPFNANELQLLTPLPTDSEHFWLKIDLISVNTVRDNNNSRSAQIFGGWAFKGVVH